MPTETEKDLVATISSSKTGQSFLAGALGGIIKCTCTLPLDVIKTTQQISTETRRSVIGQARYLYSTRGIGGFFVGYDVVYTQQIGKVGIQFASFQFWDSLVHNTFIAGACAGVTEACLWTTPSERIKIIQQAELASTQQRRFAGSTTAIRYVLKEMGPLGLFRGVIPTALRQASSLSVRFFTYSECKEYLLRVDADGKGRLWHAPLSGGVCGVVSASLNQPIDVIKTNMMGGSGVGSGAKSMVQTWKQVVQVDGLSGLYKGWQARSLKIAVGQAIVFGVYGNIREMLRDTSFNY